MVSAPRLIWHAFGAPPPDGKTGLQYKFEPCEGYCATCAEPIESGVPFAPRRKVAGIDNATFSGHAEYARYGTHVCGACAWFYGDPKHMHRSVIAVGDKGWSPTLAQTIEERPRWRNVLRELARAAPDAAMSGVMTVDPKPRLWPRMEMATVAAPGLYVHSPNHDWSRWTHFDLRRVAMLLRLVDEARAWRHQNRRLAWARDKY